MRKRRNIAFAVLILAVLAALVLSLSACAEKQTKNALEPYSIGWDGRVYTVTPIDNDKGTICLLYTSISRWRLSRSVSASSLSSRRSKKAASA